MQNTTNNNWQTSGWGMATTPTWSAATPAWSATPTWPMPPTHVPIAVPTASPEEVERLRDMLKAANIALNQERERSISLKEENEELKARVGRRDAEILELEDRVARRDAEIKKFQNTDMVDALRKVEIEADGIADQYKDAKKKIQQLESVIADLQKQLNKATSFSSVSAREVGLQSQLKAVKLELETLTKANQKRKLRKSQQMTKTIENFQTQIGSLEATIGELKIHVAKEKAINKALTEKYNDVTKAKKHVQKMLMEERVKFAALSAQAVVTKNDNLKRKREEEEDSEMTESDEEEVTKPDEEEEEGPVRRRFKRLRQGDDAPKCHQFDIRLPKDLKDIGREHIPELMIGREVYLKTNNGKDHFIEKIKVNYGFSRQSTISLFVSNRTKAVSMGDIVGFGPATVEHREEKTPFEVGDHVYVTEEDRTARMTNVVYSKTGVTATLSMNQFGYSMTDLEKAE